MVDKKLFTGHRTESIRAELLNNDGVLLGDFENLTSFTIDGNNEDEIKTAGRIEAQIPEDLAWLSQRIKLYYSINENEYPLGVFLIATPTGARNPGERHREADIYDKTLPMKDHLTWITHSVDRGGVIMDKVKELINYVGEDVSLPNDRSTAVVAYSWEPGTAVLEIVNSLISSIGYKGIYTDSHGNYVVEKLEDVKNKSPVWVFENDEASIYDIGFTDERDTFNIPNRCVAWSKGSGNFPGFYTMVENRSNGPLSIDGRGRVVTTVLEDVEANTQSALDELANKELATAQTVDREFVIEHAWVPLNLEDIVEFHNDEYGIHTKCEVISYSHSFNPPEVSCKTTLKVIEEL